MTQQGNKSSKSSTLYLEAQRRVENNLNEKTNFIWKKEKEYMSVLKFMIQQVSGRHAGCAFCRNMQLLHGHQGRRAVGHESKDPSYVAWALSVTIYERLNL